MHTLGFAKTTFYKAAEQGLALDSGQLRAKGLGLGTGCNVGLFKMRIFGDSVVTAQLAPLPPASHPWISAHTEPGAFSGGFLWQQRLDAAQVLVEGEQNPIRRCSNPEHPSLLHTGGSKPPVGSPGCGTAEPIKPGDGCSWSWDASGGALIKFLLGQDTDSDTTLPLQHRVLGQCQPHTDLWLLVLVNVGSAVMDAGAGTRSPQLREISLFFLIFYNGHKAAAD